MILWLGFSALFIVLHCYKRLRNKTPVTHWWFLRCLLYIPVASLPHSLSAGKNENWKQWRHDKHQMWQFEFILSECIRIINLSLRIFLLYRSFVILYLPINVMITLVIFLRIFCLNPRLSKLTRLTFHVVSCVITAPVRLFEHLTKYDMLSIWYPLQNRFVPLPFTSLIYFSKQRARQLIEAYTERI